MEAAQASLCCAELCACCCWWHRGGGQRTAGSGASTAEQQQQLRRLEFLGYTVHGDAGTAWQKLNCTALDVVYTVLRRMCLRSISTLQLSAFVCRRGTVTKDVTGLPSFGLVVHANSSVGHVMLIGRECGINFCSSWCCHRYQPCWAWRAFIALQLADTACERAVLKLANGRVPLRSFHTFVTTDSSHHFSADDCMANAPCVGS